MQVWERCREVVAGLSEAMQEGQVFSRCGPVLAIDLMSCKVGRRVGDGYHHPEISPPEQLPALWQALEQAIAAAGSEDKLVKSVWREERYWPRELAQEAYEQLRGAMSRAMAQEMYLVWFLDRYTYLPGFYDPVRSRPWLHG